MAFLNLTALGPKLCLLILSNLLQKESSQTGQKPLSIN